MNRAVLVTAVAVMALATACGDTSPTSPRPTPGQPSSLLFDGSRLGNADFFFLPPIAADPKGHQNYSAGKFNPHLRPVVRVCLLDTEDMTKLTTAACVPGQPAAEISSSEISTTEDFYKVVWKPRDAGVDPDGIYRLQVFVGTTSLGFADLAVINSKAEARSAITNEVFAMNENRSIPIKFRIETGALGACQRSPNDCTEVSVSPAGGTFFTSTHFAAVTLQPGWASAAAFAAGGGTILLTVERVQLGEGESCHGAASGTSRLLEEQTGCYHYETDPDLDEDPDGEGPLEGFGGFQTEGNSVAQCSSLARTPENSNEDWMLFKSDPGRPLQALRDVPEPAGLSCADFAFFEGLPSNPVLRFASLKWHYVAGAISRAVGVKEAYAWDLGLGGLLLGGDGFSNISRARAVSLAKRLGDNQSAPAGTRAPVNPTVRLTSVHPHHHESDGEGEPEDHHHPVAGVAVTFRAVGGHFGDGSYGDVPQPKTEITKLTDENGEASVPWYLGPGANTVTAEAAALDPSTVTFVATGIVNGSIAGAVRDAAGAPFSGTPVRLVSTVDEGFTPRTINTDGAGAFSFADLPAGTYAVSAAAVGFNIARQVVPLDQGQNATVNLVLTPLTGTVTGLVANSHGDPITGATMTLTSVGEGTPQQRNATTNADGFYTLSNVPIGDWELSAAHASFNTSDASVTVAADGLHQVPFVLKEFGSDVVNDPAVGTSVGCGTGGESLFQGFTPTVAPLIAVELRLRDGGSFPAEGVTTRIRIRLDSPTGEIVAQSSAFVTPATVGIQRLIRFNFSELNLTAGRLHIIEWLSPLGPEQNNEAVLTWMGSGFREIELQNPYPGGTMYGCGGTATPAADMNFKTFFTTR